MAHGGAGHLLEPAATVIGFLARLGEGFEPRGIFTRVDGEQRTTHDGVGILQPYPAVLSGSADVGFGLHAPFEIVAVDDFPVIRGQLDGVAVRGDDVGHHRL